MTETSETSAKLSKKFSIIVVAIVIAVLLIGALAWLYTGQLSNAKTNVFAKLPLPVAIVNSRLLTGPELIERMTLAGKLTGKTDLPADIRTNIYDQLVEGKKVEVMASERRITISNDELSQELTQVISQNFGGDKDKFTAELKEQYDMSEQQFKDDILRQDLLMSKLSVWFNQQESLNGDAYKLAKDLLGKLNNGQSFDEVAAEYTKDEATKDFAGDNGFVTLNDLLPEYQSALKDAQPGASMIIASRYGLHIIRVLEQDNNGEGGSKRLHLQQIFVQPGDFNSWFEDQTSKIRVIKLLKI